MSPTVPEAAPERGDRTLQFAVLQILQAQVDTQREVLARLCRLQHTDIAHHLAVQILDVLLLARLALQPVVIGQFQTGNALTVDDW